MCHNTGKDMGYVQSHLLLTGVLVSFLDPDPDGEGRVPLLFFGRTVPLFTVGRNGRVAIIGLAGRQRTGERCLQKKSNYSKASGLTAAFGEGCGR